MLVVVAVLKILAFAIRLTLLPVTITANIALAL